MNVAMRAGPRSCPPRWPRRGVSFAFRALTGSQTAHEVPERPEWHGRAGRAPENRARPGKLSGMSRTGETGANPARRAPGTGRNPAPGPATDGPGDRCATTDELDQVTRQFLA